MARANFPKQFRIHCYRDIFTFNIYQIQYMKLVYYLLLVIWLTCITNYSYAQKNPSEYIVKDSTYSMGKVIPLGKGKIQFQRTKKEQPVIYNALEIKEYGYDGKVYESLLINGSQKFLKKIVSGKVILYQDKKLYALKVDTSLILINKGDYRSVISESVKCEGNNQSLLKLSYSKTALSNYIKEHNSGKCNTDNFPYKKFGGYLGYNFLQFNSTFGSSLKIKDNIAVPTLGLFIDLPLYRPRSLFTTTELNWFYGKPLFYSEDQTNTNYSGLNVNGINLLLSGKWLVVQNKMKTYFKTGALFSFINITSPTGLVSTKSNGSFIDISQQEISKSNTFLYGSNSGIGLEIPYKKGKNFHFEFKYLKTFDGSFDFMSMNFSGFSIIGGFNI